MRHAAEGHGRWGRAGAGGGDVTTGSFGQLGLARTSAGNPSVDIAMTMKILQALHKVAAREIAPRVAVLATLLACVVCASGLSATSASAAEAGVNLNTLEPSGVAQVKTLGAHWVRVFAPWPDLEPSPGVHSAFWFPRFERAFSTLPKGTKVIVDFVGAPSWE